MSTIEKQTATSDLYQEELNLFNRKNWPDFQESWFMKDEAGPVVLSSVATAGNKLGKPYELAGSMSPVWGQPFDTTADLGGVSIQDVNLMSLKDIKEADMDHHDAIVGARKSASRDRLTRYFERQGGPDFANDVVIIKPQVDHYTDRTIKGNIVNADDLERTGDFIEDDRPAFMIYSHDPNRILAIRPADCPTISFYGHDRDGRAVHGLMHAGWQDEDAGFIEQGLDYIKNELNCDISEINFAIGPGGVEFGYSRPYDPREGDDPKFVHDGWKTRTTDHEQQEDGKWRFTIDMPGFASDRIVDAGARREQIFIDSTDTSSVESGNASHKQASRGTVPPMRDIVTVASPERE